MEPPDDTNRTPSSLSPEDQRRIYDEERARLEVRRTLEAEYERSRTPAVPLAPPPQRTGCGSAGKGVLGCAGLILLVMIGIAVSTPSRPTPSTPSLSKQAPASEAALQVQAADMAKLYEENEVAADLTFKGKALVVTGIVDSINKDFTDSTYIVLRGTSLFNGVHCRLVDSEQAKAATLKKDTSITVTGVGGGAVLKSASLDECRIR